MATETEKQPTAEELHPPLEPPDADIAHCLGILQPILQMTITELDARGKPGWAGFLDTVYGVINDVFTSPEVQGEG